MILINFLKKKTLLYEFNVIIVSILLFSEVTGKAFESINQLERSVGSKFEDTSKEEDNDYRHDHETYYYENEQYPYEALRQVVEQTKELLLSSNPENRGILKFHPKHDETYISGSNKIHYYNDKSNVPQSFDNKPKSKDTENSVLHHRRLIPKNGIRKIGKLKNCRPLVDLIKPQHLKSLNSESYLIVNLENDFIQEVNITSCIKGEIDTECGNNISIPEHYVDVCQTSYGVYELFSIPRGEEINISNQVVAKFELPNGCMCKRKQI